MARVDDELKILNLTAIEEVSLNYVQDFCLRNPDKSGAAWAAFHYLTAVKSEKLEIQVTKKVTKETEDKITPISNFHYDFKEDEGSYDLWKVLDEFWSKVYRNSDLFKFALRTTHAHGRLDSKNFSQQERYYLGELQDSLNEVEWVNLDALLNSFLETTTNEKYLDFIENFPSQQAKEAEERYEKLRAQFRATGLENSSVELSEFYKRLKDYNGEVWNIDKLQDSLKSPLIYNNLKKGFTVFLNFAFITIDHPLIAHLTEVSTINVTTEKNSNYNIEIRSIAYGKYDVLVNKTNQMDKNSNENQWTSLTENRGLADPWGLRVYVEKYFKNRSELIRNAEFRRGVYRGDLTKTVGYIYSEPRMSELIPLFFVNNNWEYFSFGINCSNCGRNLTHYVSAIKGIGPCCGNHRYRLVPKDAKSLRLMLEKAIKYKSWVLTSASPLIAYRVQNISNYFSSNTLIDWTNGEIDREILKRL